MSRRNHLAFVGAGLLAMLAACHQTRPATSASGWSPPQTAVEGAAGQDRSAREVPGYAPSAKQPSLPLTATSVVPAPAPAPQDDPLRELDMP
jgi:hypothetical protein